MRCHVECLIRWSRAGCSQQLSLISTIVSVQKLYSPESRRTRFLKYWILCKLVEGQASGVLASILLVDDNCLRRGGAPSLPKAYTDAIDGAAIGPAAGSCGTAAYRREQVIIEDIASDPLWANYRDLALLHSFSCL